MGKETFLEGVLKIVQNMTRDFDTDYSGGVGPETHIMSDLGFQSINVVEMIVAIEKHYHRRDFPFHDLLMNEEDYHDFTIQDIADFLHKHSTATQGGS